MTPMKLTGFLLDPYAESADRKHPVGMIQMDSIGRTFRYSKNGAVALAVGKNTTATASDTDVLNEACASAHAIGDTSITETITSTTVAEDFFVGGMFQVQDGTGEGQTYEIISSSAVTAGTEITIKLAEPLRTALVATTSEFSLIHSPWNGTVVAATDGATLKATGVPLIAVTANYYYWSQTGGLGISFGGDTAADGASLMLSTAAAGSTIAMTEAGSVVRSKIGYMFGQANVSGEYMPVWYCID